MITHPQETDSRVTDIFVYVVGPLYEKELMELDSTIIDHGGWCRVMALVTGYDYETKKGLDQVARVCRQHDVPMVSKQGSQIRSVTKGTVKKPLFISDSRRRAPRALTGQQRDVAALLSMITSWGLGWRMFAYRLYGGTFGVTDGARVMTLDLSGVVPDEVMAFDPDWALISDYPWDCPMSDDQIKEYAAQVQALIPSVEGYDVSACKPFYAPKVWVEFNDLRHIIRAEIEAYGDDQVGGLSVEIRMKMHKTKSKNTARYSQPVDLRLLGPLAYTRVEWYPYTGEDAKNRPVIFSFRPNFDFKRKASLIIMPEPSKSK
jgi:hypothetical protein